MHSMELFSIHKIAYFGCIDMKISTRFFSTDFFKNILIYGFGAIFLKGVSFFLIPVYTKVLLPEEYGSLELLNTFSSILEIVFSMGLYQVLYVFYFHHDRIGRKRLIDNLISIYLFIPSIFYVLTACILFFYYRTLFGDIRVLLVYLSMMAAYLNFYVSLFVLVLKLSHKAKTVTILQVTAGLVNICLNILLIYYFRVGIIGILVSNLISILILVSFATHLYFKKFKRFSFHVSRATLKEYLSLSLPFVPGALAYWMLSSFNRWIVLHEVGLAALGVFSIAMRFGSIMEPLVIQPFLSAYSPRTLQRFSVKKYNQHLGYLFPLAIVSFLAVGFFAQWIAQFMIDVRYKDALPLIPILLTAAAFSLLAQVTAILLLYRKQVRKSFTSVLMGSIAGVCSSYFLAGLYGVKGVAYGLLIGNMVWAGVMLLFYTPERNRVIMESRQLAGKEDEQK